MRILTRTDPSQAIVLAGSGRSGTTWLGNIIAANLNMRVIFEPFDGRRVPQAAGFPLRPYLHLGATHPQMEGFVRAVLCGKVQNDWINREGTLWWAWRRMIKTIRATLLLGWLDQTFHPHIVFMLRHPCAVVLSRIRLDWEAHLDVFLDQPHLMEDYLEPFAGIIEDAQTEAQKHAMMWCVENLVPLSQMSKRNNWTLCTYEHLCMEPEAETERILRSLKVRPTYLTKLAIQRISRMTRPGSAVLGQKNPVTIWQQQLPPRDIDQVLEVVEAFGINVYNQDPLPHL